MSYLLLRVVKQDRVTCKGQEIDNPKQKPQKLMIQKRNSHQISPEHESKRRKWKKPTLGNPMFCIYMSEGSGMG